MTIAEPVKLTMGGANEPSEPDEEAMRCLQALRVEYFRANPTTVLPFHQASTLSWKAIPAPGCSSVRYSINGMGVIATGTKVVEPATTTTYRLLAKMGMLSRTLASVTVAVNTSLCFATALTEAQIRSTIQAALDQQFPPGGQVTQRAPASVEVETGAIAIRLRLKIAIENFTDPDLNISMRIALKVANGMAVASYQSFNVDVDWPWWVAVVTLGISEIVENVVEDKIENRMKPELLKQVQNLIASYLAMIPSTHRLFRIQLSQDQVNIMVCPI